MVLKVLIMLMPRASVFSEILLKSLLKFRIKFPEIIENICFKKETIQVFASHLLAGGAAGDVAGPNAGSESAAQGPAASIAGRRKAAAAI